MMLRVRSKVLLHVPSYDFYDTTLSIEQQRRHMINEVSYFADVVIVEVSSRKQAAVEHTKS